MAKDGQLTMDSIKFHPALPCPTLLRPTLLRPVGGPLLQGWPAHMAGGLRPSSTPMDTLRRSPMIISLSLEPGVHLDDDRGLFGSGDGGRPFALDGNVSFQTGNRLGFEFRRHQLRRRLLVWVR
jgi:hypothetical protein